MPLHKNPNLIFFNPRTQTINLGDVIINKNLLTILRNFGQVVVKDSKTPSTFLDEIGVFESEYYTHTYSGHYFLSIIYEVFKRKIQGNKVNVYLFYAPGHQLPLGSKLVHKLLYLSMLSFMSIIGVRICRLGISIGDFKPGEQLFLKLNSHMMFFLGIRDSFSQQYARFIGLKNIGHFPDLAWAQENRTFEYVSSNSGNTEPSCIVFSFRDTVRFCGGKYRLDEHLLPILDELVEKLCKQNGMKLVLCYQVDYDRLFMKKLEDRYKSEISQITFIDERLKEERVANIYSKDSVIVTNRLHVFLFAAMCGSIPVVLINSRVQMKITGILKDAYLDEVLIDIDSKSGQTFSSRLESIIENRSQITQKISLLHNQYHRQLLEILNNTIFDRAA